MQNFVGCSAGIYDDTGKHILNAQIAEHIEAEQHIKLRQTPGQPKIEELLINGTQYNIYILTKIKPQMFKGIFRQKNTECIVTLFNGRTVCNRSEPRHNIVLPAKVEWIYSGNKDLINVATEAKVVNISKHGVRLQFKKKEPEIHDKVRISIQNTPSDSTVIVAEVRNRADVDNPNDCEEMGCLFMEVDSESVGESVK